MRLNLFIALLIGQYSLANAWLPQADFGGTGRHRATGVSIANKGYMGLGHINGSGTDISYKDWWQFDPASNSWTQKANFPVNNHGAVAFSANSKGYVGGGSALNGEFYEFNPQTNTWTPIASCPLNVGDVQVFSVQNKGYVYLGNQLVEYNPTTNSWTTKAPAPISFNTWSSSFGNNSSGFIKSGVNFYEYKPSSDQWIARTSFPGLMSNGGAAFERNEKGYFVCGYSGALSVVTNQVWEFNPGENSWTQVETFQGTSRRFPVAFSINEKGYFGTGTNGINMNDFWMYDPLLSEINENGLEQIDVKPFPNPSTEVMIFDLSSIDQNLYQYLSLNLYSTSGQLITTKAIVDKSTLLNKNEFGTGLFYFKLTYKGEIIHTGKLIFN